MFSAEHARWSTAFVLLATLGVGVRARGDEGAKETAMIGVEEPKLQLVNTDLPACYRGAEGASAVRLPKVTGDARLVTMGAGARGIVFAPISWGDACEWSQEARRISAMGYQTLTFDWGPSREQTVQASITLLHARGVKEIVLVGGCMGGTVMLGMAAALQKSPVGLVGIAGISPLASLLGARVEAGRQYKGPVLLLGTKHDPLADEGKLREVARSFPSAEVVVLSGEKHAAEIFDSEHTATARRTLDAFLSKVFAKI